jgi:hypothetical protein
MAFQNKPGVNDPDLARPSPDVVNQAHVVLALRQYYYRGLSQGITIGVIVGVLSAFLGMVIRRWLSA